MEQVGEDGEHGDGTQNFDLVASRMCRQVRYYFRLQGVCSLTTWSDNIRSSLVVR